MSLVGRWSHWYRNLEEPAAYGDTVTYALGAKWLADCDTVEDWGCGKGWFRQFVPPEKYRGIDGTGSRFCDEVVDLETYRSDVDGVFMRHVLEHNENWSAVLANAIASADRKLFLVLFTPTVSETTQIAWNDEQGCPDISFRIDDLTAPIEAAGFVVDIVELKTTTQYGVETVLKARR